MAKTGQAHDQTMDEILASIRRMISDDGVGKDSQLKPKAMATDAGGNVSPLFAVPPAPAPLADEPAVQPVQLAIDEASELDDTAPESEASNVVELAIAQAMEEAKAEVEAEPVLLQEPEPALSPAAEPAPAVRAEPGAAALEMRASVQARIEARRAAREAFITEPLLSPNTNAAVAGSFDQLAAAMFTGAGRTIDELAADLLRPMLRDWLDDNLPPMVERLVREEIERVSRGRR
jgi:uncharacterized protein